jgi:protein TonB
LPQSNIAAAVPPPTRLEPIAGTHTAPPYPAASTHLGETGATQIRLAISALGAVAECRIVKSSGSERLDTAACSHVQQYWRWKPATQGGQPVAASTQVTIVWNLRSAR